MDIKELGKIREALIYADERLHMEIQVVMNKFMTAPGCHQNRLSDEYEILRNLSSDIKKALQKAEKARQYYSS